MKSCVFILMLMAFGSASAEQAAQTKGNAGIATQSPTEGVNAEQKATANVQRAFPIPLPVSIVEEPLDADYRYAQRVVADEREKEDLKAQQRMAKAAEEQSLASMFAAIVSAFSAVLMFLSVVQTRRAVQQAQRAADASKDSADAVVAAEGAILRMLTPQLYGTKELTNNKGESYAFGALYKGPVEFCAVEGFTVENHGRTPAFLQRLEVGWDVVHALTDAPRYQDAVPINHNRIVRQGDSTFVDARVQFQLSAQQIEAIERGDAWLWFYGRFKYRDFLNAPREMRFCWRWAIRIQGAPSFEFESDGNPPEDYYQAPKQKNS